MHKIRQKRILVVGAGAIGGIIAGLLARNGYKVELVTKYVDLADRISNTGIRISGLKGNFSFQIPSVPNINLCDGSYDYIFIATKAYDMPEPAKKAKDLLTPDGKIITIQNGIVEEEVARIVGKEHLVGCVVGWGATLLEPGSMEMTTDGEFIIGALDKSLNEELKDLNEVLSRMLKTYVVDNIYEHLYSKLIINMCVTTLGAISGYTVGRMLNKRRYRHLIVQLIREAIAVADAMHIHIPKYAHKLDYYFLAKQVNLFTSIQKHIIMHVFGMKYKNLKSSSLQSLERGKPTEIEYMNGYVSKKGKELGVATPLNDLLIRYVQEIEMGERVIGHQNFNDADFHPFYPKFFLGL